MILKKLLILIPIYFFFFSTNLLSVELNNDHFLTSTDGYTGTAIYSNNDSFLYIPQDKTATKTYYLGAAYANQTVQLDVSIYLSTDWDNSSWGPWGDTEIFYIYINDIEVANYTDLSGDSTYIKSLPVTADANGDIKVSFTIDTDDSAEWAKLDYISIDTDVVYFSTNERAFTIRNPTDTRNINGDYTSIGNTVLCFKDGGTTCIDYNGTDRNNDLSLSFIDTDEITNTYDNSSQAQLAIPANATVVWAALYAIGNIEGLDSSILLDPINITVPSITNPIAVSPKQIDTLSDVYNTYGDIPELIGKTGSEINGWVTVANIKAREGLESGLGYYGAWNLVVIYKAADLSLKNISIFDGYTEITSSNGEIIPISGFLTPSSGTIVSKLSIFAGEGDKNIAGDKLFLNDVDISHLDDPDDNTTQNAFYSNVDSGITRSPSYINNQGIDILNYDVGTDGLNLIKEGESNATIEFTSSGDVYYPSLAIFSTDLYEPRVCYTQAFYALDGTPLADSTVKVGDTIMIETLISNMKKDATDANLEDAYSVEITVNYDTEDIAYVGGSTSIRNIGDTVQIDKTDSFGDDIVDLVDENTSKWRIGLDADATNGGFLEANNIGIDNTALVVSIQYHAILLTASDINITNDFLVAYENPDLGLRFDDDSRVNIQECTDFNSSISVSGALGFFNVVGAQSAATSSPLDSTDSLNAIPTQIVGQAFSVKVLSLSSDYITLADFSDTLKLSVIQTPSYIAGDDTGNQAKCEAQTAITTSSSFSMSTNPQLATITVNEAYKNTSLRVEYIDGANTEYVCSRDIFAVRPEKFLLSSASLNMELLTAGNNYNLDLTASSYGVTTGATDYNISHSVSTPILDINNTRHTSWTDTTDDPSLAGSVSLPTTFTVADGLASSSFALSYPEVGRINISISDKTWAQVDINNPGDPTPIDCSTTGAYICGDILATFIPDHFTFTTSTLEDNGNTFTYLSNDINSSARFSVLVESRNSLNVITQNFKSGAWENPLDITFAITTAGTPAISKVEANNGVNLGFNSGSVSILDTEANATKMLRFNFDRNNTTAINPFRVDGPTETTLTATSTYTPLIGTALNVTGTANPTDTATFIYGRTHAPRQRFQGNTGMVFIYFEAYCADAGCNKGLLPDGNASTNTDDPRWFKNTLHTNVAGTAGTPMTQKYTDKTTMGANTDLTGLTNQTITYNGSAYPYKATIQNPASSWLIYNKYNSNATQNEFEIEYDDNTNLSWAGKADTNSTTTDISSNKTNRRTMW